MTRVSAPATPSLAAPSQNTRSHTSRGKGARLVQTRFIPPWITPLFPVPREDQKDVTEMEEASPSPMFSRPPGFPKVGVVDPESSWPGTTTSANWFSGLHDLSWTTQISLDSEEGQLDAGDEPTYVQDSLVDVTVPPSFQMVACSMVLEDISKLLHEVPPPTQPLHRRTSESQEQPLELLGPKDAEVEVVLLTPLCQQPPPRPWLQMEVLPSFGESGGPYLITLLTNRHASWGIPC